MTHRKPLCAVALLILGLAPLRAQDLVHHDANREIVLNGGGATFSYPVLSKWFAEYQQRSPSVKINYQPIGSGGAIRQILEHTLDFAASESWLSDEQLGKLGEPLLHIPAVLGAVVPAFNLPGIPELKFTGPLLADIYLGRVARWNDPAIGKLNPGVRLPDAPIALVHRADGSGTTFCLTDYLSKTSKDWETKVGRGVALSWPSGIGAKGNQGVTAYVQQTQYSLGYLELTYALQSGLTYGSVQNRAGRFVKASAQSASDAAAATTKTMPRDYRISITDAPGVKSYPIVSFSWLLLYGKNPPDKSLALRDFLHWMIADGQKSICDVRRRFLARTA